MEQQENCYFWANEASEDSYMNIMCQKCHNDGKEPKSAWFWEGAKLGYGPFDFICKLCGHVIHAAPKSQNKDQNEEN